MNFRDEILTVFGAKVFSRPLFYSYTGGLRFQLSHGGSWALQFLTAHQKAMTICADIFVDMPVLVCARFIKDKHDTFQSQMIAEFKKAQIKIPRQHCVWSEVLLGAGGSRFDDVQYGNIAFECAHDQLPSLLWCALSRNFAINPRPECDIYLFNLDQKIAVLPYDDRGMDVVGENHVLLQDLYLRHNDLLLDYDRKAMDACFQSG